MNENDFSRAMLENINEEKKTNDEGKEIFGFNELIGKDDLFKDSINRGYLNEIIKSNEKITSEELNKRIGINFRAEVKMAGINDKTKDLENMNEKFLSEIENLSPKEKIKAFIIFKSTLVQAKSNIMAENYKQNKDFKKNNDKHIETEKEKYTFFREIGILLGEKQGKNTLEYKLSKAIWGEKMQKAKTEDTRSAQQAALGLDPILAGDFKF